MPLISWPPPAKEEKIENKALFNLDFYQSKSEPLPPILELMEQMGYNMQRPSLPTPSLEPCELGNDQSESCTEKIF
jgi:hypothetical protein